MLKISKLAAISLVAVLPLAACSGDNTDKKAKETKEVKITETSKVAKPAGEMKKAENAANDAVVIVNGTNISKLMLDKHVQYRTRGQKIDLTPEQRKAVIEDLISLELLRQDAIKKNLDKDENIIAMIENVKRGELAQANVNQIKDKQKLTEEDLKKKYDEYLKGNSLDFNANHILVKTEDEAKNVIKEIDGGADFAETAKKHSVGPTGVKGGALGWFGSNQMVAEFTEAVKKLEVGAYTKEPVKTKFGWHVILLNETRPATVVPYEQMKKQLQMKADTEIIQNAIAELKKNAKIEIIK